jgi:hypothetical protein
MTNQLRNYNRTNKSEAKRFAKCSGGVQCSSTGSWGVNNSGVHPIDKPDDDFALTMIRKNLQNLSSCDVESDAYSRLDQALFRTTGVQDR